MSSYMNLHPGPGGSQKEGEEGLYWENTDNPYNDSDDEEGGDFYESYEYGMYYEDEESDSDIDD